MFEALIVFAVVVGYLFYRRTVTVPNIGARVASLAAAARAAAGITPAANTTPVARRAIPRGVKMLLGVVLAIVLLFYGDQIWLHMNGVWAQTPPGKWLETQGAGYSNALWFLLLLPVIWYWNKQPAGAAIPGMANPALPKAPRKPLPEWLVWILIIGVGALGFNYFTSSGNVLVNLTGNNQRSAVVTINPGDTIEVHLPGADIDIGGCSVNFGVTPNWRSQHPEVGAVFFDQTASERGFYHYATLADPLRSSLKRDGSNLEVQVTRSCTVGG